MGGQSKYQLKQYSDVFNKKVVADYLYLMDTSGAYASAINSCGSQSIFESTFLNGGSSDKISSHYRYFKDITNYIHSVNGQDVVKMDVFDLLYVLCHGRRKIKLDSFVNNIMIRHYNIKMLNNLYYLCDGASIGFSEYTKRFVALYIRTFSEEAYEDCQSYVDDFMSTTHSLLYTFSKRVSEVFSDETFERACVYDKKLYLTTNLRTLWSNKYESKGVLVEDCMKFYYDILERAKKNAFTMTREDNTRDLYSYIKEYTSVNGAKCLSTNSTIKHFLETMFDYMGLVSRYKEFAEYIFDGADFNMLDKEFRLHKYGINNVDTLVDVINNDLIWVAMELPDDYEDYICTSSYGDYASAEEVDEETDWDDDIEDTDDVGGTEKLGVCVKSDGTLSHTKFNEERNTKSVAFDFKNSDVAVAYDSSMVHSVVYAIIRGDIDSTNYSEKLHVDDMWGFVRDIAKVYKDISYYCVKDIINSFVCDIISRD